MRRAVERLDEVDPAIEVAVRFPAHERALVVVLAYIRSTVEVGVDSDLGELALPVVGAPEIGPSVTVEILGTDEAATRPRGDRSGRGTHRPAQEHHERTADPAAHGENNPL